eukprot:scaffold21369_cov84-Isochrysis_galbana.AAC.1
MAFARGDMKDGLSLEEVIDLVQNPIPSLYIVGEGGWASVVVYNSRGRGHTVRPEPGGSDR